MVSYPKIESDSFSYSVTTYVKPKGSKIFIDLRNNYHLISESIAKILINMRKYEYEWFSVELNSGDIIKQKIVKTYKNKDVSKNKKEFHYYLIRKNTAIDETPFPLITGDISEVNADHVKEADKNDVEDKKD